MAFRWLNVRGTMTNNLRILAICLVFAGIVLRSPLLGATAVILAGATAITAWWTARVERGLRVRYEVPTSVNNGETAEISIQVSNSSVLPAPWLQMTDSVPPALRVTAPMQTAFMLGAGASRDFTYAIRGARRGYYHLGPLRLVMGDVLGLYTRQLTVPAAEMTVLPQILPLQSLILPAQQMFGPLPSRMRRGEDPARPAGVRPYHASDGVRRLDWKSTARSGELQVRRAEPSVAPETTLALAFRGEDYPSHVLKDSLERAIIATASLGAALLARKLPVGFISNGHDPKYPEAEVVLPQGKGEGHMQQLLQVLGRLESGTDVPLGERLARQPLPWGGTMVLIVADLTADLLPHVVALRRRGQYLVLALLESTPDGLARARSQSLPVYPIDERGILVPSAA